MIRTETFFLGNFRHDRSLHSTKESKGVHNEAAHTHHTTDATDTFEGGGGRRTRTRSEQHVTDAGIGVVLVFVGTWIGVAVRSKRGWVLRYGRNSACAGSGMVRLLAAATVVVGTWIGACVGSGSSSRVRSVRGGSGRYVEGPVRYGTVRRRRRRHGYGGTGIHGCAESGSC